ncbi:hypothetical protein, partial [Bacillus cereus]|uniref:hypothetical protein n=1 Tax=Bacillus cereus TaxID=1396 RepID=UPI001C54D4DA
TQYRLGFLMKYAFPFHKKIVAKSGDFFKSMKCNGILFKKYYSVLNFELALSFSLCFSFY